MPKVVTRSWWSVTRASRTEGVHNLYAKGFEGRERLGRIREEVIRRTFVTGTAS
jgi:hypothetical protein